MIDERLRLGGKCRAEGTLAVSSMMGVADTPDAHELTYWSMNCPVAVFVCMDLYDLKSNAGDTLPVGWLQAIS